MMLEICANFNNKYIWNSLHPYETLCGSSVKWPHIPEIYKNGNVGRNSIYMTKSELMASVSFEYFSNIAKKKFGQKYTQTLFTHTILYYSRNFLLKSLSGV